MERNTAERDLNAMAAALADERTLEALDFAAIREAVAGQTASVDIIK